MSDFVCYRNANVNFSTRSDNYTAFVVSYKSEETEPIQGKKLWTNRDGVYDFVVTDKGHQHLSVEVFGDCLPKHVEKSGSFSVVFQYEVQK